MRFNSHSHLVEQHATLSASQNAWTNYEPDKMLAVYEAKLAAARGTEIHAFAAMAIKLRQRLEDTGQTLNMYVNDAIGFLMDPEVVLFVNMDAFCTADAIGFVESEKMLRVHDLKTGLTETSMRQLEVGAAYFCIEYKRNPFDLNMEFRIYQNDAIKTMEGDPHRIVQLIEQTKQLSAVIARRRREGQS